MKTVLACIVTAMVVAVATAGAASLISGSQIKKSTITNGNIHKNTISSNRLTPGLQKLIRRVNAQSGGATTVGAPGSNGTAGAAGSAGTNGTNGAAGANGLNAGVPVADLPAIAVSGGAHEPSNPNPDSGVAGAQGWYLSGNGTGGSVTLTNGAVELSGGGVDSNTAQGAIGVAKAFNSAPLGTLNALSYDWHVNVLNGNQAPTIHVTVSGLTNDSTSPTGFANLVFSPAINGITVTKGQQFQADGFAAGAKWYSTREANIADPGGQDNPQPLSHFITNDPSAVISQISLDNGGTSPNPQPAFAGSADDLLLGFTGGAFTRYDFGE